MTTNKNKKNTIGIIVVILLIVSGIAWGYFYTQNSTNNKTISFIEILKQQKEEISKPTKINGTGIIKATWDDQKELSGNFELNSNYEILMSYSEKKLSLNLKNKITGAGNNPSTNEEVNFKDIGIDLKMNFIDDKFYININTDLDKLAIFAASEEEKASLMMFGSMFINKNYVFDFSKLPVELTSGINLKEKMWDLEGSQKIIDKEISAFSEEKPFTLKSTGKTEKINGESAEKFKVVIDTEKTINFIFNIMTTMPSDEINFSTEELQQLTEMKKMLVQNKDILEKNISGEMFIWVTSKNTILKESIKTEIDLGKIITTYSLKTGGPEINIDNIINLDITTFIQTNIDLNINTPENAIDIMSLISGFMGGPIENNEMLFGNSPVTN